MFLSGNRVTISGVLACIICAPVWSDDLQSGISGAEAFSRTVLLQRFDRDADGAFNDGERKELHEAFGGVDVPVLPSRPFRYTNLKLPNYLSEPQLRKLENTTKNNPLTDAGATLGRVLFYDKHLSANDTIACASCHLQQHGFSDPRRLSIGFNAGRTKRNSMGLVNLRFSVLRGNRPGFFWDERAATLEEQVLMPIQDKVEMGMALDELKSKLQKLPYYPVLFNSAFGTSEVTSERIAKATAQFMRAMVSFNSRFDRAADVADGDYSRKFPDFTDEENLGKSLFIDGVAGIGEIGCAHCHVPPTFGMPKSFNNGLDIEYKDQGLGARNVRSNDPFTPTNDGKFKAPSLRNIALTAPYMHDGRFESLEQVIDHYSSGVHPHTNLGLAFNGELPPEKEGTSGFRLTAKQKSALVAFLKTLTDEKFVSDSKFSDPFVRLGPTGD